MDLADLFVAKVRDLHAKVEAAGEFDLLGASGHLRHLLLDGLTHKVNRTHRLPLRFGCRDATWTEDHSPESVMTVWAASADPHSPNRGHGTKVVTIDGFLAHPVAYINGVVVTVKDAIHCAAYVDGGVHSGEPRSPEAEALIWLEKSGTRLEDATPATGLIKGIGTVAVRGLGPLVTAVEARQAAC